MKIYTCSWDDISWIPQNYDTEYATFADRKGKETWFNAVNDGQILGIGCLLHLNKTTVRHSNDFVLPSHRGKGIIKQIVLFRESWARTNGYIKADVRTIKKYYETLGYKSIKDYKVGGSWYVKELI